MLGVREVCWLVSGNLSQMQTTIIVALVSLALYQLDKILYDFAQSIGVHSLCHLQSLDEMKCEIYTAELLFSYAPPFSFPFD